MSLFVSLFAYPQNEHRNAVAGGLPFGSSDGDVPRGGSSPTSTQTWMHSSQIRTDEPRAWSSVRTLRAGLPQNEHAPPRSTVNRDSGVAMR